jgi:hypothetical protein
MKDSLTDLYANLGEVTFQIVMVEQTLDDLKKTRDQYLQQINNLLIQIENGSESEFSEKV